MPSEIPEESERRRRRLLALGVDYACLWSVFLRSTRTQRWRGGVSGR